VLRPLHAFDLAGSALAAPELPVVPLGGDNDCVRCTGSLPGIDDTCWRGSVARYVWDLADRQAGGWVVPLGAAADGPHRTDQLSLWTEVRLAPIVTDWERLTETT
jgi:penicillin amidase